MSSAAPINFVLFENMRPMVNIVNLDFRFSINMDIDTPIFGDGVDKIVDNIYIFVGRY